MGSRRVVTLGGKNWSRLVRWKPEKGIKRDVSRNKVFFKNKPYFYVWDLKLDSVRNPSGPLPQITIDWPKKNEHTNHHAPRPLPVILPRPPPPRDQATGAVVRRRGAGAEFWRKNPGAAGWFHPARPNIPPLPRLAHLHMHKGGGVLATSGAAGWVPAYWLDTTPPPPG